MMRIPFSYIWRSLWARRLTTALTVGGVAVVFVFAGVLMLARAWKRPSSGQVRRQRDRAQALGHVRARRVRSRATADVLEAESGVARGPKVGDPVARSDPCHRPLQEERATRSGTFIRGVSPRALELAARGPYRPGTALPVRHARSGGGRHRVALQGCGPRAELAFGGDRWTVVGNRWTRAARPSTRRSGVTPTSHAGVRTPGVFRP